MCSYLLFQPLPKTHHPLGYILPFLLHSSFRKPLNEPKIVFSHILDKSKTVSSIVASPCKTTGVLFQ